MATGNTVTAELERAFTWQPYPEQIPQLTHAWRPMYGCEIIASGPGTTVKPSFAAAVFINAPELFNGIGGTG